MFKRQFGRCLRPPVPKQLQPAKTTFIISQPGHGRLPSSHRLQSLLRRRPPPRRLLRRPPPLLEDLHHRPRDPRMAPRSSLDRSFPSRLPPNLFVLPVLTLGGDLLLSGFGRFVRDYAGSSEVGGLDSWLGSEGCQGCHS